MHLYRGFFGMGLVLAGALTGSPSAVAQLNCDQLYAKRGATLIEAAQCYLQAQQLEKSMIALAAVVDLSPKTPDERRAIDLALESLEQLRPQIEATADYQYWIAVWMSLDAVAKDRGAVLPRHMFGVLKSIQSHLRRAMELNPAVHLQGPARVLGTMHLQMPGIVGGDKVLAEKLLRTAYEQAPAMSANQVAYATILNVNGKADLAKQVLTRFLTMTDEELNPYPGEPLRARGPENEADREKARTLLQSLDRR